MAELELELRRLGAELSWPETPELAGRVRSRLEAAPRRRLRLDRRALAVAFAALAVLGAVMAVPPARSAILDWLGFGGVEIRRVEELPEVPAGGRLVLGERVTLDEARRRSGHPVLVPAAAGRPDAVFVATFLPGQPVALVYGSLDEPRLLVLEFRAAPLIQKTLSAETRSEAVTVHSEEGLWIEGPRHTFLLRTLEQDAVADTQRLAGNTLLWRRGELTLRIEGELSKAEALRIAESVRPSR
jgi:hypothetical protein